MVRWVVWAVVFVAVLTEIARQVVACETRRKASKVVSAVLLLLTVLAIAVAMNVAQARPRHYSHHHARHHHGAADHTGDILSHPSGCPRVAFCGCGAAVHVFGSPVRSLWRAANWFRFPRTEPSPGMVAVRRHHVFVLEADLGRGIWLVYDANSGRHLTRRHARPIAGYVIVDPRGR